MLLLSAAKGQRPRELLKLLFLLLLLDFLFQKLTQPLSLHFYYFLSPYLSIILLYVPTYIGLPMNVYLPLPTAYLSKSTYLHQPTYLPISTYSPLTTYQHIPTYVNLPTPTNLHQHT